MIAGGSSPIISNTVVSQNSSGKGGGILIDWGFPVLSKLYYRG